MLAASAFSHSAKPAGPASNPEFDDAFDALSALSQTAYTSLLQKPGFVTYFQSASPVEELARLKIGSRPARRFGASSLTDLRAIPWVFAWSQNRHLITSWYGFGTAVESFRRFRSARGDAVLGDMFQNNALFRLVVDEVEKSLYQVDLSIGAEYASLVDDQAIRDDILGTVLAEHRKTVAAIRFLINGGDICDRFPKFRRCFDEKCADLERVNRLQVALLREVRGTENGAVSVPLLQSINTISAGLGWTG